MSIHYLLYITIRCPDCESLFSVRRPHDPNLIPRIVELVKCPDCHPEALKDVCVACRLPLAIFPRSPGRGHVRRGMCFTCYQRHHRSDGRVTSNP